MGIFLRIFRSSPKNLKEANISKKNGKDDKKSAEINNNQLDELDDNIWTILNSLEKDDKDDKTILCLKIYIVGKGNNKDYIKSNLFKKEISDSYLKNIADRELKTDQFHWIARIYDEEVLTENECNKLRDEIMKDTGEIENKDKLLKYQVILCFGNENVKILSENFANLRKSRMIFITDEKYEGELDEDMDRRYATFIISRGMTNEDLNIKIISKLWEIDCCFNEKGNQICRYTPERIFNGLEKDNSMFSINILLTGLSRSGKSTFINLLAGKIMALEADNSESVTQNISEYYIYRDDDKDEHGALKIIDTPGIVPYQNTNNLDYKDVEKKVIKMIKEQDKTFENQIHFIFFVLMKGNSLEGENIDELFKALNESKCPVFIIVNKATKKKKKFYTDIDPIVVHLNRLGCKNLSNQNNFINVNFKEEDETSVHGIGEIFKKIKTHIKGKNYLDTNLKSKMIELLNDFNSEVLVNKLFNSYESDDKIMIKELKSKIKFNERMANILNLTHQNDLFCKINVPSLLISGRRTEKKCKKVIISLSNLKGIFPSVSENIPALSIFQAVMVKEIAEGYGLDINVLNSGTKFLLNSIRNNLSSLKNIKIGKDENQSFLVILDTREITESLNLIENKVKNKLEKGKNKETILTLANLLNFLREKNKNESINSDNQNPFNEEDFTNEISLFCQGYFENQIIESKGLAFMLNYFNKCESLLNDIEYYSEKTDWAKYDIEIKK